MKNLKKVSRQVEAAAPSAAASTVPSINDYPEMLHNTEELNPEELARNMFAAYMQQLGGGS